MKRVCMWGGVPELSIWANIIFYLPRIGLWLLLKATAQRLARDRKHFQGR